MNATYLQVVHTYTSRRWIVVAVAIGALWLTFMLFLLGKDVNESQNGVMGMNFIALPAMIGGLLLAMQAKYQFAHSRARLTPGYTTPHLVVLVGLLACLVVFYPLLASWHLEYAPLGVLAFTMLFTALVVWQIQNMSGLLSLASIGLYFSFFQPTFAQLWVADVPGFLIPRVAILLAGLTGIVAWLFRLTRMREEDSDYLVPVQSGFNQQSRMEKSEARQLVTRWIARSPLHRWGVDSWHDRLANTAPQSEAARPGLLRYGMWMLPWPFIAVQMLVMMVAIVAMQYLVLSGMHANDTKASVVLPVLAQFGFLCLFVPGLACHMLATRRPRLGQELLLPITREALVDGLRRQFINLVFWATAPSVLLLAIFAPIYAAEYVTLENVVAAVTTALALQPMSIGISLRLALVQSGLQRIAGMLLLLYLLVGLAVGVYFTFTLVGLVWGALFAAVVLALGLLSVRAARNAWLNAELG